MNEIFSFTKNQTTVSIGDITIGGQPGHHPTVLFAGLFFKGKPQPKLVCNQVEEMYALSDQLGTPVIVDLFIRKPEYIPIILDFVESTLPSSKPFSVDVIDATIKTSVLKELEKRMLLNRTIYNSIHIGITAEEYNTLETCTPNGAIIVAFNPKDKSPDGKIEVLENGAHLTEKGLLQICKDLGIKNILIDTAALAPGENTGGAIAALPVVKEEYGLPVGCAIHNVVEKSMWLQEYPIAKPVVDAASNTTIPLFGGDYAIFGPVERSPLVLPIIAWQDILISEYTESYFGVAPVEFHPRRKLQQ